MVVRWRFVGASSLMHMENFLQHKAVASRLKKLSASKCHLGFQMTPIKAIPVNLRRFWYFFLSYWSQELELSRWMQLNVGIGHEVVLINQACVFGIQHIQRRQKAGGRTLSLGSVVQTYLLMLFFSHGPSFVFIETM